MSFVAGSDRRDRWTLKFVHHDLEAASRERTFRLIEPAAEVRALGAERLKGRSDLTAVCELLGLRDTPMTVEARAG